MRCTGITARLPALQNIRKYSHQHQRERESQQTEPGNFERLHNYTAINFNSKMSSPQLPGAMFGLKYYFVSTLWMVRIIITGLKTLYT